MSDRPISPQMVRAHVLFIVGVVTLVALVLGNVRARQEIDRLRDRRVHSRNIMQAASRVSRALTDVEMAARGLAASESTDFLEGFNAGRRDLGPALAALVQMTTDSPAWQANVSRLDGVARARVAQVEEWLRERRNGRPAAVQPLLIGDGTRAMDQALHTLDSTDREERQHLMTLDTAAQQVQLLELSLSALAAITALACFSAAFVSYRREYKWRLTVEGELQSVNEALERRVGERTVALSAANARIQEKLEELGRAEQETHQLLAAAEHGRRALLSVVEDHQQAAAALRQSEGRYRRLVDSNVVGVIIAGTDGRVTEGNDRFLNMIGRTREELQAGHVRWDTITPPRWSAVDRRAVEELTSVGVAKPFEKEYVHSDGHRVPIRVSAALLDGTAGDAICLIEDLTDRKRADEALRDSEEKFSKAFHSNPAMVVITTLDGKTVEFNQSYADFIGYSREELLGKSVADLQIISAEERQAVLERIQAAGGAPRNIEVPVRTRDGRRLHVLLSADIVSLSGVPHRITTLLDITDRKRAALALLESNARLHTLSARMLDIQESERRLLAGELHDEIGQALTAAKINLQSLKLYPDTVASRLDDSIGLVARALDQVRSLSLELRPPMLDDLGLVATLRWLVDQHVRRAGLHMAFTSDLPDARVTGPIGIACFRIAQEALTNIARHSGAKNVIVDLHEDEAVLHLHLRDDGKGFDVEAARHRAVQGTSLGLLGMEERATLAGGGVEWRSAPGQGTEVHAWFALPPADARAEPAAPA